MPVHKDIIISNGCIIFHIMKILKYVLYRSPLNGQLDCFQYFKIMRQYQNKPHIYIILHMQKYLPRTILL